MSFNIVDLVKDQISGSLMGQMGSMLGDESSLAAGAVDNAVPALLEGLRNSTSTSSGADSLFQAVQDQDDGLLDNLGSMLGGGQGTQVIENGTSMLGTLFGGGGLGSLGGVLSAVSGLSKGGSGSLLGMLAPIVVGVLKRKVIGNGLNAGGLASMLMGQKDNISRSMPVGLTDQLSSTGFLGSISGGTGGGIGGMATGAVAGAGAAVAGAGAAAAAAAGSVGDVAGGAAGAVGNAARGATGAVGDVAGGVRDAAGNAVGGVTDAAGNVASGARDAVGGVAGSVGDAAGGVRDAAGGAVSGVTDAAGNVAGGARDAVGGVAGSVGDAAGNAVDGVTDAAGNMAGGARDAVSGAAGSVGDAAGNAVGGVKDAAGNMAGGARDAVGGVAGSVGDAAGSVKDAAGNAVSGASGALGNAAGSATDAVGNAASNTAHAAGDAARDVQSGGGGWLKKLIPLVGLLLLGWLGLKFFGGDAEEALTDATSGVETATVAAASDLDPAAVGGEVTVFFDSATETFNGITDEASATASVDKLEELGGSLGGLNDKLGALPEAARGPVTEIVNKGMENFGPLVEKVQAIPGVGGIIGPAVEPMLEMLKGMGGQ